MNASLNAASAELVAAVADAEIGEDMRSISLRNDGGESGGSSGLKGYCAGDDGTFQEDMRVEADWKNYGTFYPGKDKDVSAWLANQRAKRSGKLPEVTPPPIKVEKAPAPAPAGAPAEATPVKSDDPDKNAKLEKLKAKLAAKDE